MSTVTARCALAEPSERLITAQMRMKAKKFVGPVIPVSARKFAPDIVATNRNGVDSNRAG